jgi:hypothetical protein
VSSTNADFETTLAEMVQAGQFLCQMHWVVKVVVQDQRADPEFGRTVSGSHNRCQGRPSIDDVIPRVQHIESGLLGSSGL